MAAPSSDRIAYSPGRVPIAKPAKPAKPVPAAAKAPGRAAPHSEPADPILAAVHQLDPLEHDLLVVLSLVVEPISRTAWAELAQRYGVTQPNGNALDAGTIEAPTTRLIEANLVTRLPSSPSRVHLAVPAEIAMTVLVQAHADHRLARFGPHQANTRGPWLDPWQAPADLRRAVVLGDPVLARASLVYVHLRGGELAMHVIAALGRAPRAEWLAVLPDDRHRIAYLSALVQLAIVQLTEASDVVLDQALAQRDKALNLDVARLLALRGEAARASAIDAIPKWGREGVAVISAFVAGDFVRAHAVGNAALAAMKARKRPALPDVEGILHLFATLVLAAGDPTLVPAVADRVAAVSSGGRAPSSSYAVAGALHGVLAGAEANGLGRCTTIDRVGTWDQALAHALHDVWLRPRRGVHGGGSDRAGVDQLTKTIASHWHNVAERHGYGGLAREFAAIVLALEGTPPAGSMAAGFRKRAAWEAALASLETLAIAAVADDSTDHVSRELVWELGVQGHRLFATPRIRAGARAKKGQPVALSRLLEGEDALLADADRRVIAGASVDRWHRSAGSALELDDHAALALVGHPRVVGPDGLPITVERGQAKIRTSRNALGTMVELVPAALRERALAIVQPNPATVILYERSAELGRLAEFLTRVGTLAVPDEGRERLAKALTRLAAAAAVEVQGDLQISGASDVAADTQPLLQLGWSGSILTVRAAVAPLGPRGPHVRPGGGAPVLVAEVPGAGLLRCARDLTQERRRCDAVLDACPTLAGFADGELHWSTSALGEALAILLELDALGDTVTLAWQHGVKLEVPTRVDLEHLQLRVAVGPKRQWFGLDASLHIDEHAVMHFRELLRAREGPRFVVLPRGGFLALSDRLRAHLDSLAALGHLQGDTLEIAPALLPLVEELVADVPDTIFDDATRERLVRLREISTFEPRLPRGFAATLRAYQREGFVWMARLAEAGLGACLADDMGLGKTVQALALLAHRAKLGPALVVCPTSVALNWAAEAARFAPTLRIIGLATTDDRLAAVAAAGPRDVVVCSYTLLGTEIETLAATSFATVVFDEAHALKNPRTLRATSARRINASFRLGLTGTPLENHLGELWSLFATLVPGLLGAQSEFDTRFAAPIAAGGRESATRLRAILRPFMLRRLKSAVLDELPARTEITLRIAPHPEQQAFYEAVRQRAVEHLAALDNKKKRLGVLAEITKLRQAAIDPRVLDPAAPKGAKLDVLFERLGELRAEGHRALVFTQFLGSMATVRERLQAESFEFFELDGSTPPPERARRIDAFQAGDGDVFLLSLRAGGTGVNLTGADYVFHLDPWWNPAVEDQATDRAHRIGQSRPVTVYRLVTAGTIEEKILALHEGKRQLADDLLAGLERSDGLDFEQLMALLQ